MIHSSIAVRQLEVMRPLAHAFTPIGARCRTALNAAARGFLRSGVPSRSGNRVMGLHGLTGNYTGQLKTPTARRTVSMATDGTSCTQKVTGQGVQRMIAPLWTVGLYAQKWLQAGAVDDSQVTP